MRFILLSILLSCTDNPTPPPRPPSCCQLALSGDVTAAIECVQSDSSECVSGISCDLPDGGFESFPGNCDAGVGIGDASQRIP